MTKTYTTTLDLSIGGDTPIWEGEATVTYSVLWGAPEQGPSYASGGQPADPDEVDDITVTHIDGVSVTQREHGAFEAAMLESQIEYSEELLQRLLEHAYETEADRGDA